MIRFLKHICIVLFCSFGLAWFVSESSLRLLSKSSFYKSSFLVNTVKEKHFDYIILGASTGLTTLNSKVIDSTLQTTGINLSMDDTALSSQYLMLQHFLAEGKSTKFCVLSPSAPSFDTNKEKLSDNDYRFLMYVDRPYVYNYYKQHIGQESKLLSMSKWFPVLGMSYYNVELFYPSLLSLIKPDKRNRFDEFGNYTYPIVKKNDKVIIKHQELKVSFTNPELSKIKALCESHNIELICYLSPMEDKKVITNTFDYTIVNHSDLLKNAKYFFDAIHVNSLGRQFSSLRFARELKSYLNISNE